MPRPGLLTSVFLGSIAGFVSASDGGDARRMRAAPASGADRRSDSSLSRQEQEEREETGGNARELQSVFGDWHPAGLGSGSAPITGFPIFGITPTPFPVYNPIVNPGFPIVNPGFPIINPGFPIVTNTPFPYPPITGIPRDFAVRWFGSANCANPAQSTLVVGPVGFCNAVPASTLGGYRVECDADGRGGVYQVCTTSTCGVCPITVRFANNVCLANPPGTGSLSVAFDCSVSLLNPPIPAPVVQPGQALITWFGSPNCIYTSRTLVLVQQNVCNVVPASLLGGYKVVCNADGTGTYFDCVDSGCASCPIAVPFRSGQCLPNNGPGSPSVSFVCPGNPFPTWWGSSTGFPGY